MPVLKLADAEIYYEEHGSGYPVLLFAPGFLSSRIERWRTNPDRPGVAQDWRDPIEDLAPDFHLIALDVRNAGQSRGAIGPDHGWHTYTADHLALLDHLGIDRCHIMGACIGVSFALSLAEARPDLVTAFVMQNPIGRVSDNGAAIQAEFDKWAAQVSAWPGVDPSLLPDFGVRMFGPDFLFSVTREAVSRCTAPMLVMPGNDQVHPAETSADLAKYARNAEVLAPWKGPDHRDAAMQRAKAFLKEHTPGASGAA